MEYRLSRSNTFLSPVQDKIDRVEALMRAQANDRHPDLGAALNIIVAAGGKRVRPGISLLVGQMLGGDTNRLITLAAAIELLHTATLVHDDLIDGSLLRRGMPTLNAHWSPGATVLTGDFLFACAAKLAADTDSIAVMSIFSKTLITIVNGEITQLFSAHCSVSRTDYYKRIYAKTASLFETSATAAALVCPVDGATIEKMRLYGHEIGMAFQIVDDVLDYTGEQAILGKPVASDLRQGLVTLPAINYIETHPSDTEGQLLLGGSCLNDEQVERFVAAIRSSDAISRSLREAGQYIERGLSSLNGLPDCVELQALRELAEYFVERQV
jgi:geranylgeranyl pyrophosphate synthase